MSADTDLRRRLPSVDHLVQDPAVRALEALHGRARVVAEVRRLVEEARALAAEGRRDELERMIASFAARLGDRLEAALASSLVTVINATGVVVHTNLGRAPLSEQAARRVAEVATSYSNLEFDLERGERGEREVHAESRLRRLVAAEAAVVVNNNAAAVLLAVNTLAEGREVLVSRGELVEIGGSFRIPDVLGKGGARLREVGTTNRTRVADYRRALGPDTALILIVHPSNFRVVGFTEKAGREELVALAREAGIPMVEDLGSGLLTSPRPLGEPSVAESLAAGVTAVTFSGDKLLGGPQAGLIVGRAEPLRRMRANPLYRALRVDKMTMAALDATLCAHESGRADREVPVVRMLAADLGEIRARAEAFCGGLQGAVAGLSAEVVEGSSAVGGGAAPTEEVPTALVSVRHVARSARTLAEAMRAGRPAVVARVADDSLVIDLRTVRPDEESLLRAAILRAAGE